MENKINIAELLKDCPQGMELDCTMFDGVKFDYIKDKEETNFPIKCFIENESSPVSFNEFGEFNIHNKAKCVIFPKGKTSWEGFHRPFKDGEVVVYEHPDRKNLQIFIFKCKKENNTLSECYLMLDGNVLDLECGMYYVTRLATEEEKAKLFQAIKDNGYEWNAETKTLEKLLKFKVGNRVKEIGTREIHVIDHITESGYVFQDEGGMGVTFENEHNYELVPNKFDINTLVPFESKVLVRTEHFHDDWVAGFFSHKDSDQFAPFWTTADKNYQQCIPYEGNEHLLGTANDCDEFYKTTWK